ncbi:MerR family transcriptional regulator [Metapseudomonas otitidis]|uniref:MerR family transcriptional regulator n=1 Tax=Metapseudomonas otitidis TaxID=319939 RepID=UPI00227A6912|nr:MerR family transcriptional regulator [Pseudomonas otitidis]WAF87407.1 MerR family transcriptional regulator [Pseudomonas otitidis]
MKTPQPFLSRLLARTPAEGDAPPESAEYTVDELAREAGTTVRNLRAYQDRGLLPPPERRGRVGIYNGGHLSRLLLIGQLLERGYSIASIRELLEAWEQGRDLAHVLGLDAAIAGAWGQPEPTRLGFDELIALFGEALTDDTLDRARELGLVEFAGDHLRVLNPRIFNAGVQLHRSGIPLAVLLEQFALIRQQVAPVADGIVGMIVAHLVNPLLSSSLPHVSELEALNRQLLALRPLVEEVVDSELARGLQASANQELGGRVGELLKGFLKS